MKITEPSEDGTEKKRGCGLLIRNVFLLFMAIGVGSCVVQGMQSFLTDRGFVPTPTVRPTPTVPPTPAPTATFEQLKELAHTVTYRTLLRNAEDYKGTWVHYRGQVISAQMKRNIYGDNYLRLRVNVTLGRNGFWTDRVTMAYWHPLVRVLRGDIIEFIGVVDGQLSVFGDAGMPSLTVISLRIEPESE